MVVPQRSKSNLIRPSYRTGFPRSGAGAMFPNFWDGLRGAWIPGLGKTGITILPNMAGKGYNGVQTNIVTADWVYDSFGPALSIESTDSIVIPSDFLVNNFSQSADQHLTMFCFLKPTANTTFNPVFDTTGRHLSMMYSVGGSTQGLVGIGTAQGSVELDMPINEWGSIAITRKKVATTNTHFEYVNGVQSDTGASTGSTFTAELEIGGNPSGGGMTDNRIIAASYVWTRALYVNELLHLTEDPFAPLRWETNVEYLSPVSATGVRWNLTPDKATHNAGTNVLWDVKDFT